MVVASAVHYLHSLSVSSLPQRIGCNCSIVFPLTESFPSASLATARRLSSRAEQENVNVERALKYGERVTHSTVNNDVGGGDNVNGRNANDTLRSGIAS